MRILLWLLLALNGVAAALWLAGYAVPPSAPVAPPPLAPSAKPLQLLSELPALPQRLDAPPPSPSEAVNPPVAAGAGADSPAPDGSPGVVAQQPVAGEPHGEQAAVETPPGPVASVVPADEASSQLAAAAAADVPASEMAQDPVCYRTPALSGDTYEAAGRALREGALGDPVLQPQAGARARYWVYWEGSAAQLEAVEARLKAAGIRDWYRLRGNGGKPLLSMGVYGQQEGARRRQSQLAAKDIPTRINADYRPQARLRWTVTTTEAAVQAARDRLQAQGVVLERCP